ncbi:MAG: hypothetical protein HKN26_04600 [Acidimicrobiales bacterium]|nr:hypothetical protein [Acidimicrobiales bacterium]
MKRYIVQVARMRMADVVVGDIVNRNPDDVRSWFQVASVSLLHNGSMALADEASQNTATGKGFDIIGVQIAKAIDVPDRDPFALPELPVSDEPVEADGEAEAATTEAANEAPEPADAPDVAEGEGGGWELGADTNEAETEAKKRRSSVFS